MSNSLFEGGISRYRLSRGQATADNPDSLTGSIM